MNKVIMMGRLTRDPEVRYSQGDNQTAVSRFAIAVDRKIKREGDPGADFFNCITFGKQAEFVERYLNKGTKIVLSGRLHNNNYTNKDGQMVYGMQIIVEEIEFAESKAASSGYNGGNANPDYGNTGASSGYNGGNANPDYGNTGVSSGYNGGNDNFMNIPDGIDDDLPFN